MTVTIYQSTDSGAPTLSGTAGSLITVLDAILVNGYGSKPSLGWTKAFSGTNKAAYRQRTDLTNGLYLRVDDTGTTNARYVGYETMTDVDTGLGKFPTEAWQSGGLYWAKSSVASGTARPWWCISNNKIFYFIPQHDGSNWDNSGIHIFGDIYTFKSPDPWNTVIVGNPSSTQGQNNFGYQSINFSYGMFLARDYLGANCAVASAIIDYYLIQASWMCAGSVGYPDPVTGGLTICPVRVIEAYMYRNRGMWPGVWSHCHTNASMLNGDTVQGQGIVAGKNFELRRKYGPSGILFETSDTWEDLKA